MYISQNGNEQFKIVHIAITVKWFFLIAVDFGVQYVSRHFDGTLGPIASEY